MGVKNKLTDALSGAAEVAAKTAEKASEIITPATEMAGAAASSIAKGVAQKASETIDNVSSAVNEGISTLQENSPSARLKRSRIAGFRNGIDQGAYLAEEARMNFYYAYIATLHHFLQLDGEYSPEEEQWLRDSLEHLKLDGGLTDEAKEKITNIIDNETHSFDNVKPHLDKVSLRSLDSIAEQVVIAVEIDEAVTEEEAQAQKMFSDYVDARMAEDCASGNWAQTAIAESVDEYSDNIDKINKEFKEKTKLQDNDVAFLMGATLLQVARVLIINALTEVERAGKGNRKESNLHDLQDNLFQRFDKGAKERPSKLHASMDQILTTTGVPYDVTNGGSKLSIFKGANHRFATLAHDPAIGLVFGPSNIMTNTISCTKASILNLNIPSTYTVSYNLPGGSPIITHPVSTIEMLSSSSKRVLHEPEAAAAALLKHIIHIGTDLYTPCGIQLPLANIILDKAHAEKLTKYVSTGDILKVGAQAGLAALINWIIASLHGCTLVFKDDGSNFALETYQVRTKKILLISDTIATSSSVIQASITKNPKRLDLGGAAVLAYRLFTDLRFITKLKEEYLNTGLNEIYEERAKGILY